MESRAVADIATSVWDILSNVGEDVTRDGLKDTPARVAKAYEELLCGYGQDPAEVLCTFDAEGYNELVLLTDIPFYSMCEHHMLPFAGKASIGYIPNGKIVGLSKIARLLEVFARRLQVQERLTAQVADSLMEYLEPMGAICVIQAEHFCMTMRGIQRPGTMTTTSAVRGVFKDQSESRAEVLSLMRG